MPEQDALPQPYDAKALAPAKKRQRSGSPTAANNGEPERKLKRPGARARIAHTEADSSRHRAEERARPYDDRRRTPPSSNGHHNNGNTYNERAQHRPYQTDPSRAVINDVVRAHYNAVPERGRDWRKTDSRIKGLRSFNNWVKSCIIQKFAPDEDHTPGAREAGISTGQELLVLDMGCGKGGDLGKWQQAPQPVKLYVGLDPADVSIDQARERYRSMAHRGGGRGGRGGRGGYGGRGQAPLFEGRFQVRDCFGHSIEDVDIVREVGFAQSHISSSRGFDVVSMMFCMHYAFESEAKARQMLKNVSGALKKGGRFIGTIPNSDVISSRVEAFNTKRAAAEKQPNGDASQQTEAEANGTKPADSDKEEGEMEDTAEWGNDIYRVRFPGKTPEDGIFRPPFGWKYNFFLHEAVEEVPEYVVPWEAFRALAEDYNLELQYHKTFTEIWESEKDDETLGPLSERMGVRERGRGPLMVSPEEMEAAAFYMGFCFYRV